MASKASNSRASSAKKPAKKAAPVAAKKVKAAAEAVADIINDNIETTATTAATPPVATATPTTTTTTVAAKKLSVAEAAKAAAEKKAAAEAKKFRAAIVTAARSAQSRIGIAPIDAGAVKKTHIISIKGQPCKILEWRHSKTGKHGHTRVRLTGLSLVAPFAKLECLQPAHVMLPECKVNKGVYQLLSISGEPKRTANAVEDKLRAALADALAEMKAQEKKKDSDSGSDDENDKEMKKESSSESDQDNDLSDDNEDDEEFSGSEENSGDDESHFPSSSGHSQITLDVLDGKHPRRIVCGVDTKMKEELLASRSSDASSTPGKYVYQVTIVEAPVLPASVGRRGLADGEELEDKMTCKASLQLWRRCDPSDLPKYR